MSFRLRIASGCIGFLLVAAALLGGCSAGQSFTPVDHATEIGSRPGLLSREKGYLEFTLPMPLSEVAEEDEDDELFLPFADY